MYSLHVLFYILIAESPLSLLELSRSAVRVSLAETASRSDTPSLSQLYHSLCPPGLADHLIMQKIEILRRSEDSWVDDVDMLYNNPRSLWFADCIE
jgi:hypothetical protein